MRYKEKKILNEIGNKKMGRNYLGLMGSFTKVDHKWERFA